MRYRDFLSLDYLPEPNDCLASFYVEPAVGVDIFEAAGAVASESSIGTWTENLCTLSARIWEDLRAQVCRIEGNTVTIAYPAALFEPGNIPQFLSSVAGNVFGMKAVENLRLNDIYLPPALVGGPGPAFGVAGVRGVLGIKDRPLVGTIVKPKLGLTPQEQAEVVYEAFVGGVDIVKDDENLTSQPFSPFEERVKRCLEARARAEAATGEKKAYLPNVTGDTETMLRRTVMVKREGGRYVMVDIVTAGFAGLFSLRRADLGLVIHAHRAMYASFARNKRHGISMLVLAKLARLAGVDQLHIGTVVGKMEGDREEVLACHRALGNQTGAAPGAGSALPPQDWQGIKPVLAVASGGLHPGHIPDLVGIFGHDVLLQFGGGVHGHPKGTRAGAQAVREAVEAVVAGTSLAAAAESQEALRAALSCWGGM